MSPLWPAVVFFSSRRRNTRCSRDWSSDVCSSDLDIRRSATGLLELPRAYARHGFLFELRQAARVAARHRLLRFVRDASAAVDRHEQPGAKIPATELEAASGQFCKRERARTRAFAGAQLGIRSEEHTSELQSRLH